MKTTLTALALAATLAEPASATTFPTLTTIYVGAGVMESGQTGATVGTAFSCSNVSGQTATLRFLVLGSTGSVAGSFTQPVAHGANLTVATAHLTLTNAQPIVTGTVFTGTVNIESTQSGVFCTAMLLDADIQLSVALRLVRINGHPGAEE